MGTVFKSNKRLNTNALQPKCFEQDIWNLLKIKHFPGIDENILEEKIKFVFDGNSLVDFLGSNGATIKKFVFFKHPTPSKDTLENKRKTVEIKEEKEFGSKSAQNPYKTAEKTKGTMKMEDDSSESDVASPKVAKVQKRKEKVEKLARKRLKKEAELREREKSEKMAEQIKREKIQKLQKIQKPAMGDSSSSDENAIRPVLKM